MRIGNNMDMPQADSKQVAMATTNYSKVNSTHAIRLDITDIGKDTGLIIDQGRSMQDVISEAGALDVQTRQDYMTVVSNTMSEEDYAKMCKDGFKPSEMTGEETVTIMDHIKAVMAQSGQVISGYNDDLNIDKLKEITGSVANASALANAMKQADIPFSEENAKKINDAANEIQGIEAIKDGKIQYMLANGLNPTIDNIYMANYSVGSVEKGQARGYYSLGMQGYLAQKADNSGLANIQGDIKKAVESFEIEGISKEEQIKEATWLVEKGIDLTQKNIENLDKLLNVKLPVNYEEAAKRAAFFVAMGKEAKSADLSLENANIYEKASEILEKTENIDDNQLKNVIVSGKKINLANIWSASRSEITIGVENADYLQGRAALEEIRLRMTLDVNVSMLKRGIEIDTMPLSNLVDSLKASQQSAYGSIFGQGEVETLEEKAEIFNSTRKAVSDIPYMPAAVIGRLKLEAQYSLTTVHETGTELKARYEAAGERYETLMTAPRRDMGDSITKAFRNVNDILADIGLEINEENAKAVRILAYNSMEINASEVERIREATAKVMDVVNGLTPAKTIELIRQGINPMEMSIDQLSDRIKKLEVEESNDKYSRFLYKLEKSNSISSSEREAYIGIYRFVNRLEKTDGASIGALINSDREITFKSLLSGMRSRGVSFNESIDDNYGFLQDTIRKGVSISDQIEQAFAKQVGNEQNESLEEAFIKESYEDYMKSFSNSQEAINGLMADSEAVTADNIAAYNAINDSENNVFGLLKKFEKSGRKTDKEAAMNFEKASKELVDRFDSREDAREAYDAFISAGKQLIQEHQYSAESSIDLKQMMLCNKQLSLAFNRSSQEKYTIPVEINGEVSAISLTLKHGNKNSVTASFEDSQYGVITAHFTIDNDTVKGMAVSESRDGVSYLNSVIDGMSQKNEMNMDVKVILGKESQIFTEKNDNDSGSNADINNVDTQSLYKLAKSFLVEYSLQA